MPTEKEVGRRASAPCCVPAESGGVTRRELLRLLGIGVLSMGAGGLLAACGAALPPIAPGATWRAGADAPFTRHGHSGAPLRGRLLTMGDRRSWQVASGGSDVNDPALTLEIVGGEFHFSQDSIDVPLGEPVRVVFTNEGLEVHDFSVISSNVYLVAAPGETVETTVVFEEPDTFFCSIGGHAAAGMIGDLLVDGEAAPDREYDTESGSTDIWWYDPATDRWEAASPLPHSLDHVSLVSSGDKVYSIGGYLQNIGDASSEVWAYDPDRDAWDRVADFPVSMGRGAMAAAFDGERILCTGGRSEPEGPPSATDVFAYHVDRDEWETLPTRLPTARDHVKGAFLDGVFWVMGGRSNGQRKNSTPVAEGLDLTTGEWIHGPALPVPESAGAVVALGNRVVVFGGEGPAPTPPGAAGRSFVVFPEAHAFDPVTLAWERWEDMPLAVHHQAHGVVDEILVSVGGGPVSGVSGSNATQLLTTA